MTCYSVQSRVPQSEVGTHYSNRLQPCLKRLHY